MLPVRYTTPGIYREVVAPQPTAALPTAVPAFIGLISRSDAEASGLLIQPLGAGVGQALPAQSLGKNMPYTLWSEFAAVYRGTTAYSSMPLAVYGFFLNGGRICWPLMACFDPGAAPAQALHAALSVLATNENIDLMCAPDIVRWPDADVSAMQSALLDHCTLLGDRFALLDALGSVDTEVVVEQAKALESAHGALYFPWLDVGLRVDGEPRFVPPSGYVAGIYARSDERSGVHKAPANELLEGVLDLQFNLNDQQQAALGTQQVNVLRSFPGRGIRVWGARTLSQNPAWQHINVRRLFLTVGRWTSRNLADVAFEPNDPLLWSRIERELTGYCSQLFLAGALRGSTPAEAFYVRCDAETNPSFVRDRGEVVTEIGLAPTQPNEFIVVRMIHGAGGVSLAAPVI